MEIGTVVIETEGFFKGSEFIVVSETEGRHAHFGVRMLKVPMPKSEVKSSKPRQAKQERLSQPAIVPGADITYLKECGVDIRVYCAEEHVSNLRYALNRNGSDLPAGFEPSDTHSRGGEYRPYSFGIICTFPAPELGRLETRFSITAGGQAHIARTSFGLALIKAGFPITTWKGKKS